MTPSVGTIPLAPAGESSRVGGGVANVGGDDLWVGESVHARVRDGDGAPDLGGDGGVYVGGDGGRACVGGDSGDATATAGSGGGVGSSRTACVGESHVRPLQPATDAEHGHACDASYYDLGRNALAPDARENAARTPTTRTKRRSAHRLPRTRRAQLGAGTDGERGLVMRGCTRRRARVRTRGGRRGWGANERGLASSTREGPDVCETCWCMRARGRRIASRLTTRIAARGSRRRRAQLLATRADVAIRGGQASGRWICARGGGDGRTGREGGAKGGEGGLRARERVGAQLDTITVAQLWCSAVQDSCDGEVDTYCEWETVERGRAARARTTKHRAPKTAGPRSSICQWSVPRASSRGAAAGWEYSADGLAANGWEAGVAGGSARERSGWKARMSPSSEGGGGSLCTCDLSTAGAYPGIRGIQIERHNSLSSSKEVSFAIRFKVCDVIEDCGPSAQLLYNRPYTLTLHTPTFPGQLSNYQNFTFPSRFSAPGPVQLTIVHFFDVGASENIPLVETLSVDFNIV
ncbi:hypothetical protein B0H17DRAFT_1145874 [Mycena rosella]|uniref:Uncharacterized protein n=1 Tax=Mycena rosella TaxID=1033263 RepID=A0AAD7CQ51_MYCRO|nr:hypothetical protein B0H17DRAFT_1145874 [Mycena rosella]